jgi:hypothetical protein
MPGGSARPPRRSGKRFETMSTHSRILLYGLAGGLVLAGSLCAALVPGLTGQLLTIALISLGVGGAVLLVFLEVGLSEDRQRAQAEARRRQRASARLGARPRLRSHRPRWPRRPS